jgi:AraC-like DNA-binding protein
MTRLNLHQPYEIEYLSLDTLTGKQRRNNFFELIYVLEGTGLQVTNGNTFNYRSGNLFLLTPQDVNSFELRTPSKLVFIRFNKSYVETLKDNDWTERIDFILANASHRPGCILKNQVDKPLILSLISNIIRERNNQQLYHSKIVQQIVDTIIIIVARNIALKLPKNFKENTGESVLDILDYIQQNIYSPEMLRATAISNALNISIGYLGRYFRKQTGETLQEYIAKYKVRLIEIRLLNSDMRINEIANELNFTDESHLNRVFKKYKGTSPSEFRKNGPRPS